MNETPASSKVRHSDPDGPFGYVPPDAQGGAYDRMRLAQSACVTAACALASAVVDPDLSLGPFIIEYRRAVSEEQYARGVWEQVCERRGVAA